MKGMRALLPFDRSSRRGRCRYPEIQRPASQPACPIVLTGVLHRNPERVPTGRETWRNLKPVVDEIILTRRQAAVGDGGKIHTLPKVSSEVAALQHAGQLFTPD